MLEIAGLRKKLNEEAKVNFVDDEEIVATMCKINSIQGKVLGCWNDTCATVHVAYDRSLFKTYHEVKDALK